MVSKTFDVENINEDVATNLNIITLFCDNENTFE